MNNFKKIIMAGHTQRKEYLHHLYTDRQIYLSSICSYEQPIEDEKIFYYHDIYFKFEGTGYRTMEHIVLFIYVPEQLLGFDYTDKDYVISYEDYLLRQISDRINTLSADYKNDHKSSREQPDFSVQKINSKVLRRNGCLYIPEEKAFRIRVHFTVPLINGININGKSTFKAIREIMGSISCALDQVDKSLLHKHIQLYRHQTEIRAYLEAQDYIAFIRNGSILPRQGDTDYPMANAVPFLSPESMQITIPLTDGAILTGMAIPKGITVITGGGYSGKSTLLDALETGICNHVADDGREYVITCDSTCKIYAEDGRYIENTDISPFFHNLPCGMDVKNFSTNRASGSISQAACIIEAVYGNCKLLLIDEDTSATNFMIRDSYMRLLVENEPIIPFTDRVTELKEMGISTILVIGGSSEYLKYADTVLLMEDYITKDKTKYVNTYLRSELPADTPYTDTAKQHWTTHKTFINEIKATFFYSECVKIENARYIRIDDFVSDITKITSITSDEQINSLTYLLEKLLGDESGESELLLKCTRLTANLFDKSQNTILSNSHKYALCLEDVRALDLLMTVCRLRRQV